MPGIANKYFPIRAATLSVLVMTSAPARAAPQGHALGVFSHPRGVPEGYSPGGAEWGVRRNRCVSKPRQECDR